MIRLRSSASFPIVLPPSEDGLATTAIANVRAMVDAVGRRELSVRGARKVVKAAETVCMFADAVEKIVANTVAIAHAGATCERDLAALKTEMDGFETQQAKNAAERAEAEAHSKAIGAVIRAELEGRELTATLRNAQLRQQIAALTIVAPAAAVQSTAPAGQSHRGTRVSDVDDATLVRLSGEAQEIVRQVQAGNIPQGIRHPHHAFAGCLYLRARLDGLDPSTAAKHAREELVAHFLHGAELTGAQIRAFRQEYLELKKRLDADAASKQGTSALKALQPFGVAPAAAPRGAA